MDFLKERGILVYEGQDDLNRNEAFEHLARHLGAHFDLLAPFYEKVKRLVASGRGSKFEIEQFTEPERSSAVQFGTLLHRHGMLKDFYYHRSPKRALRVIPTKDGKTGQFLTGGWLEIFVSLLLSKRLRAHLSPAKYQMLYNVKGALPDGREFEADIMAVIEGRMFWLECKTGNWQDYSARFRGLVKTFGVDRNSSGLLLLRAPDPNTRARATDMLDMTVLSLQEVDGFLCRFLGVEQGSVPILAGMAPDSMEEGEDAYTSMDRDRGEAQHRRGGREERDHRDHREDRGDRGDRPQREERQEREEREVREPRQEREPRDEEEEAAEREAAIPLENAPPARRLGHVALQGGAQGERSGEAASDEEGGGRRRPRRRRRGRRGGGGGAAAASPGAPGGAGRLLEPLQIIGDENEESADEPNESEVTEEVSAETNAAVEEGGEQKPRRRSRRRGGSKPSPFAADESGAENADAEQVEVEKPRAVRPMAPRPTPAPAPAPAPVMPAASAPAPVVSKPDSGPKVGATGATIAPDWRKMVAGAPKKTDEAAS